MKKFIKLLPAAVALVALSSCSNEDLFSGAQETNYTKTLEVTHEGINDFTGTRSSMVPTDGNKVLYDANDVIRVYDESITLFDKYVFDGTKFGTTGTNVSDAKYAIFPSEQVKWGDSEGDPKVAVVIKDEVDLSSTVNGATVAGQKAFVANIPSWGIVKEGATKDKLEVSLYDMTGILRVAIQSLAGHADGNFLEIASDEVNGTYSNDITGAFAATLDKNIATTKNNTTTQLAADPTLAGGKTMWVNLGTEAITDAYVYLPIIAGTYDANDVKVWLHQGGKTSARQELKRFGANSGANRVFKRGGVYAAGVIGENKVVVSGSDPYNIQAIIEANKNKGMDVTVDVKYAAGVQLATNNNEDAMNHTITIPADLNNNIVLNISGGANLTQKDLTITGGNANYGVTFNFLPSTGDVDGDGTDDVTDDYIETPVVGVSNATAASRKGIVITSASPVTLTGIFKECKISANNSGAVTLGAADMPFTAEVATIANQTFEFKGTTDLNVQNVGNSAEALRTAPSGATAAITNALVDVTYAATGTVTVNSVLTSLTANTANVTPTAVNVNANVGTVITKAAKINVTGTTVATTKVTNLYPTFGASNITLKNGDVTNLGRTADLYTSEATVNVASSGISAIGTVVEPTNAKFAFTSTWDIPTTTNITAVRTAAPVTTQIYTAAQLASASANNKLMTDVTFAANSLTFEGATLNAAVAGTDTFDGNGKTITGLTGPLFGTLTMAGNYEIKNLTLKDVSIVTDDSNIGALMKTNATAAGKTLTLTNIVVNGGTIGTSSAVVATKNIGGLIGNNEADVIFDKCQVTATVKGFANIGGFIGYSTENATALTIKGKKLSNVTFAKTYSATTYIPAEKELHGTFGNFIGSVNIDATIGITVGAAAAENALSGYFTNNIVPSALEFDVNKVTVAAVEKSFVGMSGNYIGYSKYTSGGLTITYTGQSALTRQDATHNDINVFQ